MIGGLFQCPQKGVANSIKMGFMREMCVCVCVGGGGHLKMGR